MSTTVQLTNLIPARQIQALLCVVGVLLVGSARQVQKYRLVDDDIFAGQSASKKPRFCSLDQIKQGAWHPVTLPKAPYIPAVKGHSMCYSKEELTKANWSTYEWIPTAASGEQTSDSCEWTRWDTDLFCEVFRNKTIAVIGDSLSWEHYTSLANTFGHRVGWSEEVWTNSKKKNCVRKACNDTVKLVGRKNSRIDPNMTTQLINQNFPDILIMNRGAHFANDTRLSAELNYTFQEVQAWQDECEVRGRECLFVWRTTVPGHPNCRDYSEPVTSVEEMETLVNNYQTVYPAALMWNKFKDQNELVSSLLKKSGLKYEILPAYEINILRPDHHHATVKRGTIDCVHNCEPSSKTAVYTQILLHLMRTRGGFV